MISAYNGPWAAILYKIHDFRANFGPKIRSSESKYDAERYEIIAGWSRDTVNPFLADLVDDYRI